MNQLFALFPRNLKRGLIVSTNRIPFWEELAANSSSLPCRVDQPPVAPSHGDFFHSLFVPLHYEPNYAYPLVVWLHGDGDDECQVRRVMPGISMRNYVAVAPRGNHPDVRDGSVVETGWSQTPDCISRTEQCVIDSIEKAKRRYHVANDRVFLVGYGTGGTMALRVGLNLPDVFAGIASLGGPFPQGHSPLLNLSPARQLPLLVSHGRNSLDYSEDEVCRDLRLIHTAGFSVTLRQYPSADELTQQMLGDVNRWLMTIVTGQSAPETASDQSQYTEWN